MSTRPVAFHPDGSVDVVHDDATGGAHSGTVPAAQIAFLQLADGTRTHNGMALPCPVAGCGSVSFHPIGGGADAPRVQELFVRLAARIGCPCGQIPANASLVAVQAHIKLQAQRMDGVARWAVQGQLT